MKKLSKAILLSLVALLLVSMPVLAAVAYRATYTIVESGGTSYDMLPTLVSVDNQWLADNGFMQDDALDTRIETLGGLIKPHMVATNKTLTSVPIPADSQTNLYFTTANTDLSATEIIAGYDSYITIDDAATLELGSDFEIETKGYVKTTHDDYVDRNIVYKQDAFRTCISAATNITSSIAGTATFASNTSDGHLSNTDAVYNTAWTDAISDTVTSGNTASVGQLLGFQLMRAFLYFDTSALPDDAVIVSAQLRFYGSANASDTEFDIIVQTGSAGHPADPLVVADYDKSFYSGDGGSVNTATFTTVDYNNIDLNATGRGWISLTGTTKLVIRSSREIAGTEPAGNEYVSFYTNDEAGVNKDPQLVLTYWAPNITATGISSGEYTVKTYGVANEPAWATGDVLHFTGAADSNVNAGAINNNIAKLWVSLWFRLDDTFSAASATDQFIWGKFNGAGDYVYAYLESDDGILYFQFDDGVNPFSLESTTVSWTSGTWYHIITSLSDTVPAQRLLVNGTAQDTDTVVASNTPNGGDFCFGDYDDPGAGTGLIGEIQNVIIGTDDLLVAEETALYAGTAPGDETDYWYADEGTGTAITSYGTAANVGTADTACTWETATFTTGKTGRLCDFYIEVDDGVTDPDRWGVNLKGASVQANANDWLLNQNNVMPWMDYYYHTVAGVLHAWYQPDYMVEATDYDGTETAGGSAVTVTDNTMTDAPGYWVDALVTITAAGGVAPEGEASVCTVFAAGGVITVSPAFSANVDIGDSFTIDFGTLIDRSYYGTSYDGLDDEINCGSGASLDALVGNMTIEAWIKPDSLGELNAGRIVAKTGSAFRGFYFTLEATTKVRFTIYVGGAAINVRTGDVITWGSWCYVVGVYDGSNVLLYFNDNAVVTGDATAGPIDAHAGDDLIIGDRSNSFRCFDGTIDEVRIYNRALGADEIETNYNSGAGSYTPYSTTDLVGWWHMEEGSGANVADSSGEGNNGTITNAIWVNGQVSRPGGNGGTNDSRITWGVNPTGVAVSLGGMVSVGQPTPGALPDDPAQDILPETEVTDWYIEPDVAGSLLTNPLRPFVTMLSDNTTLTELQSWRLLALAVILMVTVATALAVGRHQGITAIVAGAAILGVVVLTIFPMWALVFAIGMFIGGLVMERSPSL